MKHPSLSPLGRTLILLFFLSTPNLFSQWTQQVSGSTYNLYSTYFINVTTGFLCSSSILHGLPNEYRGGEIIRTTNGGDNWTRVLLDSSFRGKGLYFLNQSTGFAVGGFLTSEGRVFKTTNSGINWIRIDGDSITSHLFNLMFINDMTGFAGGFNGVIKTTAGGNSWYNILTIENQNSSWGKTYFIDANTGFFTINLGDVYKTTDGGTAWVSTNIASVSFRDIKFTSISTGYIVGDNGALFKTTDQGANWNILNSQTSQNLFSVFFTDFNTGYITAEHTVLKTTSAGGVWFPVFNLQADSLLGSFFLNANTGYVCGDEGRIYKTTTGGLIGIPPISTEVPREFMLYQNYPNPFNPTTNIRFALPKAAFVKLAVYDMLGREVQTLVNENLSPATYEIKWDASQHSSGIYFYRIQTGDYTDVKKMSLIK